METVKHILIIFTLSLTLLSCGHSTRKNFYDGTPADTLALRYAKGFLLITHGETTEVQILDPWHKGRLLQQYTLREPLHHAAVFTAAHAALLDELGCLPAIGGVCEPQYIADIHIHKALHDGTVRNLGSAMTPSLEEIIALSPDAILLSPFENANGYGGLDRLDIPLIWCADYMEASALGRAEWMRLYGRLFGCGERADSLFYEVEARYLALKAANEQNANGKTNNSQTDHTPRVNEQSIAKYPSVIFDGRNGSAWYMPGGQSTLATLTRDAGGDYLFADHEGRGSVPLAFEEVYARGRDADIWLYRYTADSLLSLDALRQQFESYAQFKAFRTGRVYGCNNADNLFFEEYPFHPDRLLSDLTHIFRGDNTVLRYFHLVQ